MIRLRCRVWLGQYLMKSPVRYVDGIELEEATESENCRGILKGIG